MPEKAPYLCLMFFTNLLRIVTILTFGCLSSKSLPMGVYSFHNRIMSLIFNGFLKCENALNNIQTDM